MAIGGTMINWVGGIAGFYAMLVLLLYVLQRAMMYHPDQTVPDPVRWGAPRMEAVRLTTDDGLKVYAWWRAPADETKPIIVYFHGNAGHLGDRVDKTAPYLDAGYGLLLLTWRYNAGAGGKPSEEALLLDGKAALDFALDQTGADPERLVLCGESLGSGVAVQLAARRPVGAVVLEAPYSSVAEVAQGHYWYVPARWLVLDRFDSMRWIDRINVPLLVLHGDGDRVIPMRYGRKLFDAATEPKEFLHFPGGAHDDLHTQGLMEGVMDFLQRRLHPSGG